MAPGPGANPATPCSAATRELTATQIAAIRMVTTTGAIDSAVAQLNISTPGLSRLFGQTDKSPSLQLFERTAGLFIPVSEAQPGFDRINTPANPVSLVLVLPVVLILFGQTPPWPIIRQAL
jgi:hypothetical protein